MSGIELVGLSLAVFPLVISLLEHYESGYQGLRDWVRFRRDFTQLVNDLNRENIMFRQHVEGVLRSFTESEFELNRMMTNFDGDLWKSPVLAERLQHKLSGMGEYQNYQASLRSIHESLTTMAQKIGACEIPDDNGQNPGTKGLHFQKRLRKLQFVLHKKKWVAEVSNLGWQIDRIGKLLGEAEALAPGRQSRTSATHHAVNRVRSQASSLHDAITRGWLNGCRESHTFKLVMSKQPKRTTPESDVSRMLKVSFPLRHRHWQKHLEPLSEDDAWQAFDASSILSIQKANAHQFTSEAYQDASTGTTLSAQVTSSDQETTSTVLTEPDIPGRINNLCGAIHMHREDTMLGYLEDESGTLHALNPNSSLSFTSADISGVVRLDELLEGGLQRHQKKPLSEMAYTSPQLPRRRRMAVALTLTYAMLELSSTPWLPGFFRGMNVYFFQRSNGEIMVDNPFVREQQEVDHSKALLAIGIMIMELWFGQTIESRPFWKDHCDAQGREKEFTSLTAALEWQKKTRDEAGVMLHEITHRCIRGNFGVMTMDLNNADCVRTVYDHVTKPLESLLGHFWPDSTAHDLN
ncbi:hypothetical protein PG994_014799 [Apiospora phragmitis]|uniref:DUF7580 domain-containing protein n=1 Tax=Apiospora phragmitis TaxID=2905665 RepID=A0ABR1SUZ1_9PEZI